MHNCANWVLPEMHAGILLATCWHIINLFKTIKIDILKFVNTRFIASNLKNSRMMPTSLSKQPFWISIPYTVNLIWVMHFLHLPKEAFVWGVETCCLLVRPPYTMRHSGSSTSFGPDINMQIPGGRQRKAPPRTRQIDNDVSTPAE